MMEKTNKGERANKGANETKVKKLLDGRSAPLKKT